MKLHDSYFAYNENYLTGYIVVTWYVDYNEHFLTYFAKNSAKIACFYDFLAEN